MSSRLGRVSVDNMPLASDSKRCDHAVHFYATDEFLCDAVVRFLHEGLLREEPALIVATREHRELILSKLEEAGQNASRACETGQLILLDAEETLAHFMIDGMPDAQRFNASVGNRIKACITTTSTGRLRAYGEMVDVLWRQGRQNAALALEDHWNALARECTFSLLCAYRLGNFYGEHADGLNAVHRAHSHVAGLEEVGDVEASALRDRIRALEMELAHRQQFEVGLREALAQRGRAEDAVRTSEQELADFFENAVEAFHWVGADGCIIRANRAELALLGYDEREYIGHHIAEFHADPPAIADILRRLGSNETLVKHPARLRAKDGSIKEVLISSNALFKDGAFVRTRCLTQDVTELNRLASELAAHNEALREAENRERIARVAAEENAAALQSLNRIGGLLNSAQLDLEKLVQTLTDEATALVGAQFGAFFYTTVDERGESLALYTLSGAPREAFAKFGMPRNTNLFGPTFAGAEIIRSDDVQADPRYGHNAPHHGMPSGHLPVVSYLAVPVISRTGRVLGGLFFGHPERARFTSHHEQLLRGVAAHAAIAIDNAETYRAARLAEETQTRRARQASMAAEIAASFTEGGDLRGVLDRCCASVVRHLDAAFARIWTADEGQSTLELQASAGKYTHVDGGHARVPVGTLKIGLVASERQPHLTNDIPNDPRISDREWARREGIVAFAGYPLVIEDKLIGVFAMFATHPLPEDTLESLAAVANTIAVGIERKRIELHRTQLLEELAERNRVNELLTAVLAHDLRNPLGAISAAIEIGLMDGDHARITKSLTRARSASERMASMIDQLLDFSRCRAPGALELNPSDTTLLSICERVVDELADAHPEWRIEVSSEGDSSGCWDVDRLLQVLSNLASNAIQHGDPKDGLQLHADGSTEGSVIVSLRNTGTIPANVLPTLFDPFRRGDRSQRVGADGLGLGLFITKQLVLAHGGLVDASSSDEQGTVFTVRLPRRLKSVNPEVQW